MSLDRPRFRQDLEVVPFQADGQAYVEVRDPTTGGSFQFYDLEYRVALSFDGLSFDRVIPWLKLATGMEFQEPQLREFALRLDQLGFLESSTTGVLPAEAVVSPESGWKRTEAAESSQAVVADRFEDEAPAALEETTQEFAASPTEVSREAPTSLSQALEEAALVPDQSSRELEPPLQAGAATEQAEVPEPRIGAVADVASEPRLEEDVNEAEPVDGEAAAVNEGGSADEGPVPEQAAVQEAEPVDGEAAAVNEGGSADEWSVPQEAAVQEAEPVDGEAAAVNEGGSADEGSVPQEAPVQEAEPVDGEAAAVNEGGWADEGSVPQEAAVQEAEPVDGEAAVVNEGGSADEGSVPEEAAVESAADEKAGVVGAPVYLPAQAAPEGGKASSDLDPPRSLQEAEGAEQPEGQGGVGPEWQHGASESEPFYEPATVASESEPLYEPAASEPVPYEPATVAFKSEPFHEPTTEVAEADSQDLADQSNGEAAPEGSGLATEAVAADEEAAPVSAEAGSADLASSKDPGARLAAARQLDSLAFPVLPTPPPQSFAFTPPPVSTPPVRSVSQAFVTPRPTTLGPLLVAQQAALRRQQRRSLLLFGSLGVLAAVAVLLIVVPFFFPTREPARAEVRVLAAAPGTIFRYFPGAGGVSALPGPVLKFPVAGKVARVVKAGSVVGVGDVLAAVESARPLLNQLTGQRERLAFYQQMAEGMRQVGNADEEERQAANVETRKAKIAKTLRALAQVAVVATVAGEVEEAFTREGETVEAGSLALRLRSAGHRATFEMPRALAAEARRLGLCQVGVDSLVLDCSQSQERGDDTHVTVDIPSLPPVLTGRPARLARARFDTAVALPASAVLGVGRRHHVLLVSPLGRVEVRPVTLAEQNVAESIVIQGLDPGDNIILEPSPDLRPGMHVAIKS